MDTTYEEDKRHMIDDTLNRLGELSNYQRAKIFKQLISFNFPQINEYKNSISHLNKRELTEFKKQLDENESLIKEIIKHIQDILTIKKIQSLNEIQVDTLFKYLDNFFGISELKAFKYRLTRFLNGTLKTLQYNPRQLSNKLNEMKTMTNSELRELNINNLLKNYNIEQTNNKTLNSSSNLTSQKRSELAQSKYDEANARQLEKKKSIEGTNMNEIVMVQPIDYEKIKQKYKKCKNNTEKRELIKSLKMSEKEIEDLIKSFKLAPLEVKFLYKNAKTQKNNINHKMYKEIYKKLKQTKGGKKSTLKKIKKIRKHQGIYQKGPKKGKLKPGFKYSGKKTKTGLKVIVKVSK